MLQLVEDLKYAARLHRKALGFTIVAVSTLALGTGASTAVFSAVNAVLLKPLPYSEPERIVIPWRLASKDANLGYDEIPWGAVNFQRMLKMQSFESAASFKSDSFNLSGADEPLQLAGLRVSSGFFHTLGIQPLLGRAFSTSGDRPGGAKQVILSDHLWQTRFHGDSGILGRGIHLNGMSYRVIGVMPAGFEFPRAEEMPACFDFPHAADIWIPLTLPAAPQPGDPDDLAVVGRLRPGVPIASAQAEMNVFTASMDREFPDSKGWFHSRVTGLAAQVAGDSRKPLLLILGAAGVLLLIAFVNVANLLLTRALGRRNEFALRAALGAGKATLVRQLLTESILLSLGGGTAGVLLAENAIHLLKAFGPRSIPRLQEITLDWRVLLFALAISTLCTVFFGLAPAAGLQFEDLARPLREGGRGGTGNSKSAKLRGMFLVVQIALAFVLVVASGLLVRTFIRLLAVDPGFKAEQVLTFELSLPSTKYKDGDRIAAFYQRVLESLRAIPGVLHAGIVETVPMAGASDGSLIRLPDRPAAPGKDLFANYNIASPDYFSAVGTPLLRGRGFLDSDTASAKPVVIVNAAMAKKFWPGENPVGKRVGLADPQSPAMSVVGVAADVKHLSLREETGPEMYVPYTQKPFPSMLVMHVALRARMDAALLTGSAREQIHRLDADLPVSGVATLSAIVDESLVGQRLSMYLIGAFGVVSLILACIGLYGVISYSVLQRTREMGIRMALGADRARILALVLGQGARLTGVGMATGLVACAGSFPCYGECIVWRSAHRSGNFRHRRPASGWSGAHCVLRPGPSCFPCQPRDSPPSRLKENKSMKHKPMKHSIIFSLSFALLAIMPAAWSQAPDPSTCVPYTGVPCYTPRQLHTAYGLTPLLNAGYNGTGQTIVLIESFGSPTIEADLKAFDAAYGLPDPPSFQVMAPLGTVPFDVNNDDQVAWAFETALDVQWSHAMAPGAAIVVLTSPVDETEGIQGLPEFLELEKYALDNHMGNIVSQSWGTAENTLFDTAGRNLIAEFETFYGRAAAEQVTVLAGAGDFGSANLDVDNNFYPFPTVLFPASSPFVLAVGGTSLQVTSTGLFQSETVWNDENGATGGGVSQYFGEPFYQYELPRTVQGQLGWHRGIPDVAFNADPVFTYIGFYSEAADNGFYYNGGTSESTPAWAGVISIANQLAGRPLGFVNPVLYGIGALGLQSDFFHDITVGNNGANGVAGYNATVGWDLASGWGSPNELIWEMAGRH